MLQKCLKDYRKVSKKRFGENYVHKKAPSNEEAFFILPIIKHYAFTGMFFKISITNSQYF
ncbi:MAG: hypothetical protein ACI9SJ_001940 [Flavobacteriaceae bacterium]|jgi:hypothetical protein